MTVAVPSEPAPAVDPWRGTRALHGRAALTLGTMNFGGRTPAPEAASILARALDVGLTTFDTANAYCDGASEQILGRSLRPVRERVKVATKVGFRRVSGRPEGLSGPVVLASLTDSLRRLGTDYVDLLYLHVPDHETPLESTVDALATLLEQGKVHAWGVSNYASWQVLELMALARERAIPGPTVSQVLYNLLIRQLDLEYFKFTARHPVHTTVFNPLAGGLLSGRDLVDGGGDLPQAPRGSRFEANRMYQRRYWSKPLHALAASYRDLAITEGWTLLDLAYAFLACHPSVDSIVLGPATVEHLDQALAACQKGVSRALRAKIDDLHAAFVGTDTSYAR